MIVRKPSKRKKAAWYASPALAAISSVAVRSVAIGVEPVYVEIKDHDDLPPFGLGWEMLVAGSCAP